MIYKTPTEIYQKVSENLQSKGKEVDYETAKAFNKFLFRKVNNMMASFEHMEVYLPKLGYFKFRKLRALRELPNMENKEGNLDAMLPPEQAEKAIASYHERLDKFKALIAKHDLMISDKAEFKKKVDEYYQGHISESEKDMGGNKE